MSRYLIITGHIEGYENIKKKVDFSSFDYIICADKGLQYCHKFKIHPSLIVGDLDSVDNNYMAEYSNKGCPVMVYPSEKDMSDTELAVRAALFPSPIHCINADDLIKDFFFEEDSHITVLGGLGKRFDHTLANIALLEKYSLPSKCITINLIDGYNNIEILLPGTHQISTSKEKYIGFISLSEKTENLTLSGFLYDTAGITLQRCSSLCISNEIRAESATLSFDKGTLLMVRSND